MARRSSSSILSILALAACAACLMLLLPPAQDAFVAPPSADRVALRAGAGAGFVQGYDAEGRAVQVAVASDKMGNAPPQNTNQLAGPRGLNLLFVGLLGGTAAIGLLALFFYGAYSGTGSSI
eukprot:CAMPEP_0115631398 /NCGR_PEP_ID=MMETSP0272-20121206/30977_1 /TAXON_ID=71861 /ORGANISM="Scrippsiella trochoidea, Strain CCMP3099" /LENGTH=121 /DNA_ID=CAMNT_0003068059 /DNA_START=38 /DNA_END=403 /DNA_ORIENTATION=-